MSIIIGNIELSDPVILAPMSGITDRPFRQLVTRLGAGMVVSEMLASREAVRGSKKTARRARRIEGGGPHTVQIAGCMPEDMSATAEYLEGEGADIIDINMGCPAKKVVNGMGGSALMREEDKAARIIEATVNAVKIPVTLKMRTGWDADNRNAPRLAKLAEDIGVRLITVHGRTREQRFNGKADWDFISKVKDNISIPVVANGDVCEPEDAKEILERSGADGVMIGRGCYGRPWLLRSIIAHLKDEAVEPLTLEERRDLALEHYDGLLSFYGVDVGHRVARKHVGWYLDRLGTDREDIRNLQRTEDIDKVRQGIVAAFDEAAA